MDELKRQTFHRLKGEPVQNVELFRMAWHEFPELKVQDEHVWLSNSLYTMSELDRFEIAITAGDRTIGAAIVADDPWDPHVGPCMSVFAQYVMPEYRNRGVSRLIMREALTLAREYNAGVLAYTHRLGPWKYATIYKRNV